MKHGWSTRIKWDAYHLIGESLGEEMLAIVPEPTSLALLGLGGLLFVRRRRDGVD